MRLSIAAVLEYGYSAPTDVLLAIEAASLPDQEIVEQQLTIIGIGTPAAIKCGEPANPRSWCTAQGDFVARYHAIIDVKRGPETIAGLAASPRTGMTSDVIPYLFPSRYCEADRLESFAMSEFGGLTGGALVAAIVAWVGTHVAYVAGASNTATSAVDTFLSRKGVCRDFAHLTATLVRAMGIPARLASAYAWRVTPPDFHAVVEVWLDGNWRMIDPSGLALIEGMVRIAAGRDATDIAFMTSFGIAELRNQTVQVDRLD